MEDTTRPETLLAAIGVGEDPSFGAVAPPIYLSAPYAWADPDAKPDVDYGRGANPSRATLARALAALEGAAGCVATSSGMAAIDLVLSLLKAGDLVVAPHDCYGGTHRLLAARADQGHIDVLFVDQSDPAALAEALARGPALVWIETPSNPLMRVVDVAAIAGAARAAGALTAADNTFLSPLRQRPLDLGCDLVVHSTTKFLNGHSDVVGGAALAADAALAERLAWWANCVGATGAAFDSFLTLRGLRTLAVRLDRQEASAGRLAVALAGEPGVARVHYPGLPEHPGHALAARQQTGFGAMLSVSLAAGSDASAFLRALSLVTVAPSLGGFETLACRPDTMTHAGMDPAAREAAGVHDRLIRVSVGLEHPEDLLADLRAGVAAARA